MSDWNWFFSSLAQSVAALVGVLAAFMIARLLNSQAEFSRNVTRTDELLMGAERLRDAAKIRYFDWYNRRTNEDALERVLAGFDKEPNLSAEERYEKGKDRFSDYSPRAECVRAIDAAIARTKQLREFQQQERERKERERRNPYGLSLPNLEALNITPMSQIMTDNATHQQLTEEGEEIERLRVEVMHHIRQVHAHVATITNNPERSPVVTATLVACALLFYLGIIYPLSFLPVAPGADLKLSISGFVLILFSLRGVLLILVAVVFSSLLLILHRTNSGLMHDAGKLEKLRGTESIAWYSPFLEIAEVNRAAAVTRVAPEVAS